MKTELVRLLADPTKHQPLKLNVTEQIGEDIFEGYLESLDGSTYRITQGIPRFVRDIDSAQQQTSDAFGFKWKRRDSYDSPEMKRFTADWLVAKYGFESLSAWASYFDSREQILDLGCGSGFSSSVWLQTPEWQGRAMWVGLDISSAIDVAKERLGMRPNTHFVQADALNIPFADNSFDTIFSEGVLHHTPSTQLAIRSGARVLRPKGEFLFYVYRLKAPIREFTDDYIRHSIAELSDGEVWETMRGLTDLGRVLAELEAKVTLEEDIPLLGISRGSHDVQRLVYWHFAKLFWNKSLSFEENLHVNFDWYRPAYAHRHTEQEIRTWCEEAGLNIYRWHEQESGFSVIAVKEA